METIKILNVYKNGSLNGNILSIVASNNENTQPVSILQLSNWVHVQKAIFPALYSNVKSNYDADEHILYISEDNGKTHTMALQWQHVYELETDKEMDLVTHLS